MGVTVQTDGFAKVELAKVTGVNFREYTVDVITNFTNRPLVDIPWQVPYTHGNHGGGINFMPETGSDCYVCIPADETAFVLGWIQNPRNIPKEVRDEEGNIVSVSSDGGPDFSGFRHPLEPGDVMLSATDDNFIILRRGGVLQIGSTALAQRVYIPIENTVRDFFQRYQAFSPLGEIEWGHATLSDEDDMSSARNTPVLVKYNIKAKAQEDVTGGKFTVEVRAGTLSNEVLDSDKDSEHLFANSATRQEDPPTIFSDALTPFTGIPVDSTGAISITIYSHEEGQEKVTYTFQVDTSGNNFIRSEASVHVEVADTVYAKVNNGVKIDFGDLGSTVELLKSDEFKAMVKSVVLEAIVEIKLTAPIITLATSNLVMAAPITGGVALGVVDAEGEVTEEGKLGGSGPGDYPVVIDMGLLSALAAHTHIVNPLTGAIDPSPSLIGITTSKSKVKASE